MEKSFLFVRRFATLFVLLIFLGPLSAVSQTTGSISGTVIDVDTSNPLENVTILVLPSDTSDQPPQPVATDENGEYIFTDLAAGVYNVRAQAFNQNYIAEYYNDKLYSDDADAVTVTAGANTPDIDFELATGGMISGRVVDSNGAGIEDMGIFAFTECYGEIFTNSVTDAAGAYTIMGLPSGPFYLVVGSSPYSGDSEWYKNAGHCEDAEPVPVTLGSTTEDIDFQLGLSDSTSSFPISTDYKIIQLTDNSYEDENPRINNNGYVVWSGNDGSDYEIFLYDGSSTSQLTDNDFDDEDPRINDHDHIVWSGRDGTDYEIFLFDGSTTAQLTDNSHDDLSPQINNNDYVVWSGNDGSDYEIFLYDGSTTSQLTDNGDDDSSPKINDNENIAWRGGPWTGGSNIFIHDGQTITKLTDNAGNSWSKDPQINNNGYVVWRSGDMENSQDIWLYDGSTVTRLYYTGCCCDHPRINDSGHVVWTDSDIYLYDGSTVEQLTTTDEWESNPDINKDGYVAWTGFESGLLKVFVFDGSSVVRLVDKGYDPIILLSDLSPQINDSGHLVWQGNDGSDTDIFYAYPLNYNPDGGSGDDNSDGGGGGCFISSVFE